MNVFSILIYSIITAVIIYLLYSLFIFTPQDQANSLLISKIAPAVESPGSVVTFELSLASGTTISSKALSSSYMPNDTNALKIIFKVHDNIKSKFTPRDSELKVESSIYKENVSVVCNPYYIYDKNSNAKVICEIGFGFNLNTTKSNPVVYDLNRVGFGVQSFDFNNQFYSYALINSDYNLDYSNALYYVEKSDIVSSGIGFGRADINFSKAGNNTLIIAKRDTGFNSGISRIDYQIRRYDVKYSYDNVASSCITLNVEPYYLDLERDQCIMKYNCSGCSFAFVCKDAWENKGFSVLESSTSYAIAYDDASKCS